MMKVRVRLFAAMAQRAGTSGVELELPEPATVEKVASALRSKYPNLPWTAGTLWALNQTYAAMETKVHHGDEVAIIPPVSGG